MTTPGHPRDRRQHERVTGPFDGRRVGLLDTPVQIYDLSLGGCFVNSMHEQAVGMPVTLRIELPFEGWLEVEAEVVYRKEGFGFGARFLDLDADTTARLSRSIDRLRLPPS